MQHALCVPIVSSRCCQIKPEHEEEGYELAENCNMWTMTSILDRMVSHLMRIVSRRLRPGKQNHVAGILAYASDDRNLAMLESLGVEIREL